MERSGLSRCTHEHPAPPVVVHRRWGNISPVDWLVARDRPSPIGKQRGACRPVLARQHVRATCNRLVGRPVIRGPDTTPCQSETGLQPKRSELVAILHSLYFSYVFHPSRPTGQLNSDERVVKINLIL